MIVTVDPPTNADQEPGDTFVHDPVLLAEVVDLFADAPSGTVVDGTLGGAGHTSAILAAHSHLNVVGVDRDPLARSVASERLAAYGDRAEVVDGTFDDGIALVAARRPLSGVLLDLGVSSPQIDRADRGFSYSRPGPLDMRMDSDGGPTAADVLATIDESELAAQLRRLADEPHARRIARALLDNPPTTTAELAERVRAAVPARDQRRGDPAKRTFQALRILVNDELAILERALDVAIDGLAPGGVIVVISYHSGEDRLVKDRFRNGAEPARHLPRHLPIPEGLSPELTLLTRKAVTASAAEQATNPRATSARLRAARRADAASDRSST